MTEEQIKKVYCCYCKEQINLNAKICSHCGYNQKRYRQWFNQYINHAATIISIFFLVVACLQYNEAKKEGIKAQEALVQAQEALVRTQKTEKKITDSSKAIAKVLLALSILKNSIDSFDVLKFFPTLMQKEAESLLDAIELNDKERQEIFKLPKLLEEWIKSYDERKKKLEKEIEQLISR